MMAKKRNEVVRHSQCFRQYYSSGPLRMQSLRSQGYYDRGADLREPEDPG